MNLKDSRSLFRYSLACVLATLSGLAPVAALAQEPSLPTLALDKTTYASNESITVRYSDFPAAGKGTDWLSIAQVDQPDNRYRQYIYLRGKKSGEFAFRGQVEGSYEIRGYFDWPTEGYTPRLRLPFLVDDSNAGGLPEPIVVQLDPASVPPSVTSSETQESAVARRTSPEVVTGAGRADARSEANPGGASRARVEDRLAALRRRGLSEPEPEPEEPGPLAGIWEGRVDCTWLTAPGDLVVRLISFEDMTVRGDLRISGTPETSPPFHHHVYGSASAFATVREGVATAMHRVELDPGSWVTQPEGQRFGTKLRMYQDDTRGGEWSGDKLTGCRTVTLRRTSSTAPGVPEPTEEVLAALDRVRYPARLGDRAWNQPLSAQVSTLAGSPLGDAPDNFARCRLLNEWIGVFYDNNPEVDWTIQGYDATDRDDVVKLFSDTTFVPVFGRPLESLAEIERAFITDRSLNRCGLGLQASPAVKNFVGQALYRSAEEHVRAVQHAATHRAALAELPNSIAAFEALPTSADAYDDFRALRKEAAERFEVLWAAERSGHDETVEATHVRLAPPTLARALDEVLASAEGVEGAKLLAAFEADFAPVLVRVPDQQRSNALARVIEKLDATLEKEVELELAKLEQRGESPAALVFGTQWFAEFSARFDAFEDHQAVTAAAERFFQLRRADLDSSEAGLRHVIDEMQQIEDVLAYQRTYFGLPGDREHQTFARTKDPLRRRTAEIYAALEERGVDYLPLTEWSPLEEEVLLHGGPRTVPDDYPTPRPHEIMLALLRTMADHSGERVGPNTVRYQLPSLRSVLMGIPGFSPSAAARVADHKLPVYTVLDFANATDVGCEPRTSRGYVCSYSLETYAVAGTAFNVGGSGRGRDLFVLGRTGWRSPSLFTQLDQRGLETWGAISEKVLKGLNTVACLNAGPLEQQECLP